MNFSINFLPLLRTHKAGKKGRARQREEQKDKRRLRQKKFLSFCHNFRSIEGRERMIVRGVGKRKFTVN